MEHIIGKDDPRIRERAYALWERDGRPEGRHIDHWQQATREIAEEDAALGPDAGIQVPDNASERTLREAAEHLRGVDAHPHGHAQGRASAKDPA
ncbi:DUF2934 domain-containing protein [Azospirillum canadense]|uniref:DUF2934 domain-containing protein n=1 Tax=Azospirillum canadense TaxID=403962 RepID=UPI002225D9F3|nr:DUF2934 domain-containing protein [Azospirillum canadense]MCW2235728.1 hypothetical protein [Azospirillum canadense]